MKVNSQLERAQFENLSSLPGAATTGRVAFNTTTGFVAVDNGSAWKPLVDDSTAQTLTNKTLTSPSLTTPTVNISLFTNQGSTPSNPSAGTTKVYTKTDNNIYTLNSSGIETQIGGVVYINAHLESTNGPSVGTSDAVVKFNTTEFDTNSAYSAATGLYTAPVTGKYQVNATIITAAVNLSTTQAVNLSLYKNGSSFRVLGYHIGSGSSINHIVSGIVTVELTAGDTIGVYANSGVATSLLTSGGTNYMDIRLVG